VHFCAFFFGKIWRSLSLFFLHSPLADFLFFSFFAAQLQVCVVCIALPTGLAVVPTQGSYFAFAGFFFRKQMLWLGRGSKG